MSKILKKRAGIKETWDDKVYNLICGVFLAVFIILVFYPLYFVLVASFTEPTIVNSGRVLWYPVKLFLRGYEMVFKDKDIWISYGNTLIYTVGGTLLGTTVVVLAGFALSRSELIGRSIIMKLFVFTMYFGGGTIPLYLVVRSLGLVNTRAIMIILGSVSVYNIIVVRSFMLSNIPKELHEAAVLDGCGYGNFFVKIVLPLSKAVIAVMVLYIAVSYWNAYFNAMIFLTDATKFPLQLRLREILLVASALGGDPELMMEDPEFYTELRQTAMVVKYAAIVVATVPILTVYPFIQKYFVKGVMIGSVKG